METMFCNQCKCYIKANFYMHLNNAGNLSNSAEKQESTLLLLKIAALLPTGNAEEIINHLQINPKGQCLQCYTSSFDISQVVYNLIRNGYYEER